MTASSPLRPGPRPYRPALFALVATSAIGCNGKTIDFDTNVPTVSVVVSTDIDTDAGVNGQLQETMSTAFASAVWQYGFFGAHPDEENTGTSSLVALAPQHVLVQVYDSPEQGSSDAPDWDFSELDAIVQPLLQLGQEPALQIINSATTPAWLDPSTDPDAFAEYCANIVRYYNSDSGVSLPDGGALRSPAGKRITWWAILSDPNTAQFTSYATGAGYAAIYTDAVTHMAAVDPDLRFIAPEFNDCYDKSSGTPTSPCHPSSFIPAFLGAFADAGQTPIDALSMHMFSTNFALPEDAGVAVESDQAALQFIIPDFAADVAYVRQQLNENGRSSTPIWITESQVNSDTPLQNGTSQNYHYSITGSPDPVPGDLPFEADPRGTDMFFAAWRPALFSQLAKAGASALFQWQYTAGHCPSADAGCSTLDSSDTDRQNAEVDYISGNKYLSYWVDFELSHKFSIAQDAAAEGDSSGVRDILSTRVVPPADSSANIEVLATRTTQSGAQNGGDVVVVMVVNATASAAGPPVDGPGEPETVIVDLSAVVGAPPSAAWSASMMRIDASDMDASIANVGDPSGGSDMSGGPSDVPLSLSSPLIRIPFPGYGVTFLTLTRTN